MHNPFGGDDPSGTFRVNVSYKFASFFLMLFIITAVLMSSKKDQAAEVAVPAGSVWIESYWQVIDPVSQKLANADVDLGVEYRGGAERPEENPIWFSNLGGRTYNLERDDLGNRPGWDDFDPINYEVTKSRGIPVGETCVNLHLYRNSSSLKDIPVMVTVRVLKGTLGDRPRSMSSEAKPVLTSNIVLERPWQELNVFCFTMNEDGDLVKEKTFRSDAICFHSASGCEGG